MLRCASEERPRILVSTRSDNKELSGWESGIFPRQESRVEIDRKSLPAEISRSSVLITYTGLVLGINVN